MKLLADENIHSRIVGWLRTQGHDVVWVTESLRGQMDKAILDLAQREQRVIVTSDLDFGELVFQQRLVSAGIILARLEQLKVDERIARLDAVWPVVEANAVGEFIVVTPRKLRIRSLPRPPK